MAERHSTELMGMDLGPYIERLEGQTIEAYAKEISQEKGISVEEAVKLLYALNLEGKIGFSDSLPPTSLLEYYVSWYSAWFWLIVGFGGLMTVTIYLMPEAPPFSYFRIVTGLIFTLFLPGWVFIETLYAKREELEDLERFALSVGLSIAIVPLTGFVLNYTPWGIRLDPIFTSITLLTLLLGVAGVYRKYEYFRLGLEAK